MGRNLSRIVLETYHAFDVYAEAVREDLHWLNNGQEGPPPAIILIDALLPQGGVLGIRQSVNIAKKGEHAHNHEYYVAKSGSGKDVVYLFIYYDDESRWKKRPIQLNARVYQSYSALSRVGGRGVWGVEFS